MARPRVSIVIPSYNREQQIAAAIKSVQQQDIPDIEIIVVDDCSKDGTVGVVKSIQDDRIRLIEHPQNKGEAGARNTGVRAATGEYVAYLDSDDYWLPGKLKAQLDFMDTHPEVGGVYTLHYRIYKNGKKSITGYVPGGGRLTFEKLLVKGASISAGSTLMFRRDLYEQVGPYDEQAKLYVDWDWLLRFLRISSLELIPEPYAVYEKNPNFRKGKIQDEAAKVFLAKHQATIDALPEKARRECLSRIYLDIARCYAENEGLKYAAPFYFIAVRLKPLMSPGAFLNIIDGVFGTNILSYVDSVLRSSVKRGA